MLSERTSYPILFLGVLALSTSAIWVRLAHAPAEVIAFYRLFMAGLMLLPFLALRSDRRAELRVLSKAQWRKILLAGALLALHYVLWFESLGYTSTASSTVLVCLQPVFSLALERLVQHKRHGRTALVGCGVALLGSAVIGMRDFQISGQALRGDLLAVVAGAVISCYYFLGQDIRREISAITYSVAAYFTSAAVLLVYILLRGSAMTGFDASTWGAFLGIALIATVGGQFVFNLLLKKMPSSAVTMSILGEPVGTCILARLLLRERIAPEQLLGIALILGGLGIYFFHPAKKEESV